MTQCSILKEANMVSDINLNIKWLTASFRILLFLLFSGSLPLENFLGFFVFFFFVSLFVFVFL